MLNDLRAYLLTPPSDPPVDPVTPKMAAALLVIQSMVGTRMYPDELAEAAAMPALVYLMVDDRQGHLLSGANDGLNDTRVQIDVYASNAIDRDTLGKAVQDALDGYIGTMGSTTVPLLIRDNSINSFESDRRQYRRIVDFKVHYED